MKLATLKLQLKHILFSEYATFSLETNGFKSKESPISYTLYCLQQWKRNSSVNSFTFTAIDILALKYMNEVQWDLKCSCTVNASCKFTKHIVFFSC